MPSSTTLNARARLGQAVRVGNQYAATEARRDLAAAKLEQYVAKVVAEAPPLTADQISRISGLLRPAGGAA